MDSPYWYFANEEWKDKNNSDILFAFEDEIQGDLHTINALITKMYVKARDYKGLDLTEELKEMLEDII